MSNDLLHEDMIMESGVGRTNVEIKRKACIPISRPHYCTFARISASEHIPFTTCGDHDDSEFL
jgi:hypothetical protein